MLKQRLANSTLIQTVGRDGGGNLRARLDQLDRVPIMEQVKALRDSGRVKDQDVFGRWCLSIPQADYAQLVARRPELAAPDHETRQRAWKLFLASDDSAPYRVRENAC